MEEKSKEQKGRRSFSNWGKNAAPSSGGVGAGGERSISYVSVLQTLLWRGRFPNLLLDLDLDLPYEDWRIKMSHQMKMKIRHEIHKHSNN